MGSNPKGRGAEETRERLPAQRARREAPRRPPAEQAEPLTAHHRKESDRLRLVAFLLPVHGFEPELLYI